MPIFVNEKDHRNYINYCKFNLTSLLQRSELSLAYSLVNYTF